MSRAFWFAVGAASGAYTFVRARRTVENFTPDGLAGRLAAWNVGARAFGDEVRAGMAEREAQLVDQLRLDSAASRLIDAPPIQTAPVEMGRAEGNRDGHR